ncbi:hypothetical protein GUJ93_ZPchr0010g9498 [Zizania palustris]|uniref:Uncharacterized protein n=1 Tax=Zizania palustris TaxID=103762 RepID=A0A8J6BH08_ZIZPA|nr:hypothetical protein GUJ93_ZPchr0010g9498 [Zizania palustris]
MRYRVAIVVAAAVRGESGVAVIQRPTATRREEVSRFRLLRGLEESLIRSPPLIRKYWVEWLCPLQWIAVTGGVDGWTRLPTAADAAGCWMRLPTAVEAVRSAAPDRLLQRITWLQNPGCLPPPGSSRFVFSSAASRSSGADSKNCLLSFV